MSKKLKGKNKKKLARALEYLSHDFSKIDITTEKFSQEAIDFIQEITVGKQRDMGSRDASSTSTSASAGKSSRKSSSTAILDTEDSNHSSNSRKRRRRSCGLSSSPAFLIESSNGSNSNSNSSNSTASEGDKVASCTTGRTRTPATTPDDMDEFSGGGRGIPENIQSIIANGSKFMRWDYSLSDFVEFVGPTRPLAGMVLYTFNERGFLGPSGSEDKISMKLRRVNYWADCVDKLYNNSLPFHNSLHALDTLQAIRHIIETPAIRDLLSDYHVLALCNKNK